MMVNELRRIRYKNWFLQSRPMRNAPGFLAWASLQPSSDPISAADPVYFQIGGDEMGIIEKLKAELDALEGGEG